MLLTSSNIYIKDSGKWPDHDYASHAVVSSRTITLQKRPLSEDHGPNEMHRELIYEALPPNHNKRIYAQFFTLHMFIYKDEWRP